MLSNPCEQPRPGALPTRSSLRSHGPFGSLKHLSHRHPPYCMSICQLSSSIPSCRSRQPVKPHRNRPRTNLPRHIRSCNTRPCTSLARSAATHTTKRSARSKIKSISFVRSAVSTPENNIMSKRLLSIWLVMAVQGVQTILAHRQARLPRSSSHSAYVLVHSALRAARLEVCKDGNDSSLYHSVP